MNNNHRLTEEMEDLVSNLQSRVESLQTQYITFVSFSSELLSAQKSKLLKAIDSTTTHKELAQIIAEVLQKQEDKYRRVTSGLGFSISTESVQEALSLFQNQILLVLRQKLIEKEAEKKIYCLFSMFSEVVYRNLFKHDRKNSNNRQKSPLATSNDKFRTPQKKVSEFLPENNKSKSQVIDKQNSRTISEADDKEKEFLGFGGSQDMNITPKKSNLWYHSRLSSNDNIKFRSIMSSPSASPVIDESNRTVFQKFSISADTSFDLGKLRQKLGKLSNLLNKFSVFASHLSSAISLHPDLEFLFSNFKTVKNELALALNEIISANKNKSTDDDLSTDKEIYYLKTEIANKKKEITEKNEEINEINEQVSSQFEEIKLLTTEVGKLKIDCNKTEREKEELRLEVVYLKNQMERYQKNNKLLQESLITQENKIRYVSALKSKYEEIIQDQKAKPRVGLFISGTEGILIKPEKTTKKFEFYEKLQKNDIESFEPLAISNPNPLGISYSSLFNDDESELYKFETRPKEYSKKLTSTEELITTNKKFTDLITEKNKIEEEMICVKEAHNRLENENKDLVNKLVEAMEMCKILEEFISKSNNLKTHEFTIQKCENIVITNKKGGFASKLNFKRDYERSDLKARINELEQTLIEQNIEMFELTDKYNASRASVEKYKQELAKSNESILNLENLMSQLQEEYLYLEATNELLNFKQSENSKKTISLLSQRKDSLLKISKIEHKNNKTITELNTITNLFTDIQKIIESHEEMITNSFVDLISRTDFIENNLKTLKTSFSKKKNCEAKNLQKFSIALSKAQNEVLVLKSENKELKTERKNLLNTRDKLITQCNLQSDELISLKTEYEEKYSKKLETAKSQIEALQVQINNSELKNQTLKTNHQKTVEKNEKLLKNLEEKQKECETLKEKLLEFKKCSSPSDPNNIHKDEIFQLKLKNAKLEESLQDHQNSQLAPEELIKLKDLYVSQILKIDEDRKTLEKKLFNAENNSSKEKESFQRSLDSFAKQLTGANLEIHNLKAKLAEANNKFCPKFDNPDDYKIIKLQRFEDKLWYLIKDIRDNHYLWIDKLPYSISAEEKMNLEETSESCEKRCKKLEEKLRKIQKICRDEGYENILSLIIQKSSSDEDDIFENTLSDEFSEILRKKNDNCRSLRISSEKNTRKSNFSGFIDVDSYISNINESNKSMVDCNILQQLVSDKDKEIHQKNEIIRSYESTLLVLKEKNNISARTIEKYEHLKALVARFKLLNPNLGSECSGIIDMIVSLLEINKPAKNSSKN